MLKESIKQYSTNDFSSVGNHFSYRHSICPLHPQNYIVNFCTDLKCLKPLCAECIKSHQKEHQLKGTYGQFETIEEISEKCFKEILQVRQSYKEQQYQIYNYQQSLDNQEYILKEKLKLAKEKLQQTIDFYFMSMEKEIMEISKRQKSQQASELSQLIRKINENEEELTQMHSKMITPQFPKQIISFLSLPYAENAKGIGIELDRTTSLLQDQLLDVMFDETKIAQIDKGLQGFIKIHNKSYYPDFSINNNKDFFKKSIQKSDEKKKKKEKKKSEKEQKKEKLKKDNFSKPKKQKFYYQQQQNPLTLSRSRNMLQLSQNYQTQSQRVLSPMIGPPIIPLQSKSPMFQTSFVQFKQRPTFY